MRILEFRGKKTDSNEWVYGSLVNNLWRYAEGHKWAGMNVCDIITTGEVSDYEEMESEELNIEVDPNTVGQFAGLKDKNGKEIYEGDIISFRKPIRTTQTHYGDNIPNGAYTEPMEPGIKNYEGEVKFENGCFVFKDYNESRECHPLYWNIEYWDEEKIKDAISYGRPDRFIWDDPEEGDLQYLLEDNNFTEIQQLIDYLSGVEVIGNIYENTELLNG